MLIRFFISKCSSGVHRGGCQADMTPPLKISIYSNYETMTKKKKGQFMHIIMIYEFMTPPLKKILVTPLECR